MAPPPPPMPTLPTPPILGPPDPAAWGPFPSPVGDECLALDAQVRKFPARRDIRVGLLDTMHAGVHTSPMHDSRQRF